VTTLFDCVRRLHRCGPQRYSDFFALSTPIAADAFLSFYPGAIRRALARCRQRRHYFELIIEPQCPFPAVFRQRIVWLAGCVCSGSVSSGRSELTLSIKKKEEFREARRPPGEARTTRTCLWPENGAEHLQRFPALRRDPSVCDAVKGTGVVLLIPENPPGFRSFKNTACASGAGGIIVSAV
jgi:hypothetical protein